MSARRRSRTTSTGWLGDLAQVLDEAVLAGRLGHRPRKLALVGEETRGTPVLEGYRC